MSSNTKLKDIMFEIIGNIEARLASLLSLLKLPTEIWGEVGI